MTALLDWSVIVGALSIAGTVVVKWLVPAVLSLTKNGGPKQQLAEIASRDLVEAIDRAVSRLGESMSTEVVKMSEWRVGQRNLGENVLAQMTGLATAMAKLTDSIALLETQMKEAARELAERTRKHDDAFMQLAAIAKKVKA